MKVLNKKLLQKFISIAGDKLEGDWILMGGTVLPVLGIDYRVTTDIDLVAMGDATNEQSLALMEIADELGLPVETINQAGAYFLKKIPHFEEHKILIHAGKSARIFRPDTFLFLLLKTRRFSETDLTDCLAFLKVVSHLDLDDSKNLDRLVKLLTHDMKAATIEKQKRFKMLVNALTKKVAKS